MSDNPTAGPVSPVSMATVVTVKNGHMEIRSVHYEITSESKPTFPWWRQYYVTSPFARLGPYDRRRDAIRALSMICSFQRAL